MHRSLHQHKTARQQPCCFRCDPGGIEPPQVAKSATEGVPCDIFGGTFGKSRASPQLQQVISRREITCTILPLGSPTQRARQQPYAFFKVWVKPFQRLAVSKGRAFGRRPQRAAGSACTHTSRFIHRRVKTSPGAEADRKSGRNSP